MSWRSDAAPLHKGRHKAVRPDQIGRALRRALVATLVPALVLAVAIWIFVETASGTIVEMVADPSAIIWFVAGIGVVWSLWIALICRTYTRRRARIVTRPLRVVGAIGVMIMCAAVTAPMAVGARYALVTRDLVSLLPDGISATTPKVTAKNPWGKAKRVNVLLLGGDGGVDRVGIRTDTVILASIDTSSGKAILFSLPRNLQSVPFQDGSPLAAAYPNGFTSPGHETEYLLNAIYKYVPEQHPGILGKTGNEGADAVKLGVAGALGIPVDYYVLVNLSGFRKLVDAMGGITVNINEPVPIGGNTSLNIAPDSYLQPGPNQRLDGFDALWFTRGRYGSTDYQRMERQRCAINAIADEASPIRILKRYTRLAKASKEIVRTDIPRKLLPAFVDLAGKVKGKPIKSVGFERSDDFDPNNPDFAFMQAAVQAALHPAKKQGGGNGPSKASNTKDDCAYNPVTSTP